MTSRAIVGLIAAALVTAGLLAGFIPTSVGGTNCGSAFVDAGTENLGRMLGAYNVGDYGGVMDIRSQADACDSRRSLMRIPAIILLVLGGIPLIGLAGLRLHERHEAEDPVS